MKNKIILILFSFLFSAYFKADSSKITIFMIGDSTMANKAIDGGNPERGWGHMLPGFLSADIQVDNHAQNGRSSKSFIDEGRWDAVVAKIKKGDYVFIQFGHNDEKPNPDRHTVPGTTFDANLKRFVNETRAKGGIPVLFNAIARRNFNEEGVLVDTHGAYLESPRNVAKEMNVPFVDLNTITHDLMQEMGVEESKKLLMWVEPNTVPAIPKGKEDNTHLNVYGGRVVAGLAIDAVAQAVPDLAPYVRKYDFVVAKDGSGNFFTVQEAINAVPDFRKDVCTTILVRKGTYEEKIIVPESKINISLTSEEGAVPAYGDYVGK